MGCVVAEQVVTIRGVFEETGHKNGKDWTRYDIKDAGGNKYQTFDVGLGQKAKDAKGQRVKLTWVEEARGQYTNNVLKSVELLDTVVVSANDESVIKHVPESDGDRQLRIMRQSGLERAILAANILELENVDIETLFQISDQFVDYFVNGIAVEA